MLGKVIKSKKNLLLPQYQLWSSLPTYNEMILIIFISPCRLGLKHADCTHCRGERPHTYTHTVIDLDMTLNCTCWRCSSHGALEYFFIAITPRSTQTRSSSTVRFLSESNLFKNYLYLIVRCQCQKYLKKQQTKNLNMNVQWTWFPNL